MSARVCHRGAMLVVALVAATLWTTHARASDVLSIGSDGVRGIVFALDGRYLPMTTPPMALQTHYPFASRMRSIGRLDGLDAAAAGVDMRVRFSRGLTRGRWGGDRVRAPRRGVDPLGRRERRVPKVSPPARSRRTRRRCRGSWSM